MVTPSAYPVSSELGRGRYSNRSIPYAGYPAYTTATDRRYQLPSHDTRHQSTMTERVDHDSDGGSSNRKRIAVACGRCRKRKIRCSGDPGDGTPCTNCKSAGHEPCLFLRVSSTETPFRDNEFDYNLNAARAYHTRISPLSVTTYGAPEMSVAPDMFGQSYRTNNYSYSMPGTSSTVARSYYGGVSSWNGSTSGYGDDNTSMDYSTTGYPMTYQTLASDALGSISAYGRSYTSAADGDNGNNRPTYVEPEGSAYTYQSASVHSTYNMPLPQSQQHPHSRHSVEPPNPAVTNFSLSSLNAHLPTSERVIPTPPSAAASSSDRLLSGANRTLSSSTPYSPQQHSQQRTDGLPSPCFANKPDPFSSISSAFDTFAAVAANTQPLSTPTETPMFGADSSSSTTTIRPPSEDPYVYTPNTNDGGSSNAREGGPFRRRSDTTAVSSADPAQTAIASTGAGTLSNGALYYPAETPSTSSSSSSHQQGNHYHHPSQNALDSLNYVVAPSHSKHETSSHFSHHSSSTSTSAAAAIATTTYPRQAETLQSTRGGPSDTEETGYPIQRQNHINLLHPINPKLIPSSSSPNPASTYKQHEDDIIKGASTSTMAFPAPTTTTTTAATAAVVATSSFSHQSSSPSSPSPAPSSPSSSSHPSPSSAGGGPDSLYTVGRSEGEGDEDESDGSGEGGKLRDGDYLGNGADYGVEGARRAVNGGGKLIRSKENKKVERKGNMKKIQGGKDKKQTAGGAGAYVPSFTRSSRSVDISMTATAATEQNFEMTMGDTTSTPDDKSSVKYRRSSLKERTGATRQGKSEKEKIHPTPAQTQAQTEGQNDYPRGVGGSTYSEEEQQEGQRSQRNQHYHHIQQFPQQQQQQQYHPQHAQHGTQYRHQYRHYHNHIAGSNEPGGAYRAGGRGRVVTTAGN